MSTPARSTAEAPPVAVPIRRSRSWRGRAGTRFGAVRRFARDRLHQPLPVDVARAGAARGRGGGRRLPDAPAGGGWGAAGRRRRARTCWPRCSCAHPRPRGAPPVHGGGGTGGRRRLRRGWRASSPSSSGPTTSWWGGASWRDPGRGVAGRRRSRRRSGGGGGPGAQRAVAASRRRRSAAGLGDGSPPPDAGRAEVARRGHVARARDRRGPRPARRPRAAARGVSSAGSSTWPTADGPAPAGGRVPPTVRHPGARRCAVAWPTRSSPARPPTSRSRATWWWTWERASGPWPRATWSTCAPARLARGPGSGRRLGAPGRSRPRVPLAGQQVAPGLRLSHYESARHRRCRLHRVQFRPLLGGAAPRRRRGRLRRPHLRREPPQPGRRGGPHHLRPRRRVRRRPGPADPA